MIDGQFDVFGSREDISRKISEIDGLIGRQLDEILHHPEFKALEAAWRALFYLIGETDPDLKVKIMVLNAGKKDLLKDFERAPEFDESQIFKKICTDIYSSSRTMPFGLLIGAYEFGNHPQDIAWLEYMSQLSSFAHAPFVAAASPEMFGAEDFGELAESGDISKVFSSPEYIRWRNFRKSQSSRYIGLCLPRILLRDPYKTSGSFDFRESTGKDDVLRGNAAFAFGACAGRAYKEKGWLGKMRGTGTDGEAEGLLSRFTGQGENSYESALDAKLENKFDELTRHGFITLIDDAHSCPYFLNSQSVYEPPVYDTDSANRIARLHTQLENIVAASRFAINLMSLWQERSSLFNTREDKARFLLKWLERYYHNDDNAPDELKALRPLREYYLNLEEIPDKPGAYKAVLYIRPTYRLEDTLIAMRLVVYLPESPTG